MFNDERANLISCTPVILVLSRYWSIYYPGLKICLKILAIIKQVDVFENIGNNG